MSRFPTFSSISCNRINSLSWVFNAYNIVFAAFLVAASKLVDLTGTLAVAHIRRGVLHGHLWPVHC